METKRAEIEAFVTRNWWEITSEQMVVFFIDECHLRWGDLAGYVWGNRRGRAEAQIRNEKKKQTYFGALNAQTQNTIVKSYPTGNSENTIDFLETLRSQHPGQKIVVIWDGATYHYSQQLKNYLSSINQKSSPELWSIFCFRLAPNALLSKSS